MDYLGVASRKFCCCLPVRLGVLVLSIVGALSSGGSAIVIWMIVIMTAKNGTVPEGQSSLDFSSGNVNYSGNSSVSYHWRGSLNAIALDKRQFWSFVAAGVFCTIYAIFSVFGFIGAVMKRRALVAFYSTAIWFLLGFNLVSGVWMSYSVIRGRQKVVDQCLTQIKNASTTTVAGVDQNQVNAKACSGATKAVIAITIAGFVIQWLIHLYCCIIVKRYVQQLSEEQGYRRHMAGNKIGKGGAGPAGYYAHQPLGSHEMMPPPSGPYPYSKGDHSFGSKV